MFNNLTERPLPNETNCGYCGVYIRKDKLCEISTSTTNAIYCCSNCYDDVCKEYGINPQTMEEEDEQ